MINTIYHGDCLDGLKMLPSEFVNCCITSPPYYGLRDYGKDGQVGLEKTPEEYIQKLVEVFREVKRVLRKDGTLWLNLGDSYAATGKNRTEAQASANSSLSGGKTTQAQILKQQSKITAGLKPKDLIGIPWMAAFALRADGWYLRQDIIWNKPNPMPESVTDRCTKAHEYIFLLSKSNKYYFDHEAIKEPIAASTMADNRLMQDDYETGRPERGFPGQASKGSGLLKPKGNRKTFRGGGKYTNNKSFDNSTVVENNSVGNKPPELFVRNKRSVWTIAPAQLKQAHFATFPTKLIEPCVLAGCPEGGLILDPFMGAGTTALVAENNNRNYIGYELNEDYITIAKSRLL